MNSTQLPLANFWPSTTSQDNPNQETMTLSFRNGKKINTYFVGFNADTGVVSIQEEALAAGKRSESIIHISTSDIRYLHLTQPKVRSDAPHPITERGKNVILPYEKQEYKIDFKGGGDLTGYTCGSRTDRYGLYLYSLQGKSEYTRLFIPRDVIAAQRIGARREHGNET